MKARTQCILAVGLGALVSLSAEGATADAGNPYAKIAARNAFGLKDPPSPESTAPPKDPPPKITLQGIAKVLGRKQVLFKVAMPAKPPQPAGEASKILGEGEREDEIEVLEIDEVAGVIKFNNHGTPETKTLKDDAAKPSVGSVAMVAPPGAVPQPTLVGGGTAMPMPNSTTGGGAGLTTIGSGRAAGLQTVPTRDVRVTDNTGFGTRGQVPISSAKQSAANLGPEERELLIELEHQHALNQGSKAAAIFPPTSINPTRNTTPPPNPNPRQP